MEPEVVLPAQVVEQENGLKKCAAQAQHPKEDGHGTDITTPQKSNTRLVKNHIV